ncbi:MULTISPECIES: hypothetical protein [Massilia]|uniref:hypothetical protein n=1 Tax=Massilia TaxID=149698 RepID=UPI00279663BA|nr:MULTISPECIES: hypothetical protein [unclassified Massilia]MDQ1834670.1 hypothetical protein [Massilia sp. CCM 9029]MDQ1920555.1 hypothetical protein [Massilia sp. CCM 9206]
MTQASTEVQIALLIHAQALQQREIEENKREAEADLKRVTDKANADIKEANDKIDALEDERTKALKWGVMTLGTAVMGMAYWIIDKVIGGHIR